MKWNLMHKNNQISQNCKKKKWGAAFFPIVLEKSSKLFLCNGSVIFRDIEVS